MNLSSGDPRATLEIIGFGSPLDKASLIIFSFTPNLQGCALLRPLLGFLRDAEAGDSFQDRCLAEHLPLPSWPWYASLVYIHNETVKNCGETTQHRCWNHGKPGHPPRRCGQDSDASGSLVYTTYTIHIPSNYLAR